ncbi:acyltransferase family protein [Pseudomonas chlororaphis]|uniref:acyltransferase family protein n=1 Tax=Pseudomonas chlororaphis TaxID=587753 RepID=UPI001CF1EBB0|nr:acyltransferase family protein [Pseudomonas chlororaphis]UCR84376.1 acyltransferase [Pseudomonas chlororaphis]
MISGFLITQIIIRKKELGTFNFTGFYISRVRRIAPAYLVLLIVVSFGMSFLLVPRDFDTFKGSAIAALYFNSNDFFAVQNDYFAPAAYELPLLHMWSLAVEMQFYLILPFVLMVVSKRFLAPTLLLITLTLVAGSEYFLQQGHRQAVYFSLLARIPEFLIGSLAAILLQYRQFSQVPSTVFAYIGGGLVFSSFFFITEVQKFPGVLALPACLGTALLLVSQKSTLNRALSCAPLVLLGALSYSLYLWHWPILAAMRYLLGTYEVGASAALAFCAMTLGCAYVSYRYVETPFRERSSMKSTLARIMGLSATSIAVIALAAAINPRLVKPLPDSLTRYANNAEICHGKMVGDCIRGDKEAQRTLLMLGDSHAAQLNYFADIVGRSIHARIRVITSSNCVTIPGFDTDRIPEDGRKDCLNQITESEKYESGADGVIIAGMWQYQSASDKFMEQLDKFLSKAADRNQQVLVLAQVPMLSSNPQRVYRANSIGFNLPASMNSEWAAANSKVKDLVSRHKNATFLDLSSTPFFAEVPIQNHTLIYQDTHHLNEVGSQRYGEVAIPFFKSFMDRVYMSKASTSGVGSTLSHTE